MSVIVDKFIDEEILKNLKKQGITYFKSCEIPNMSSPVNTHPDMQIHFIDSKTAVVAPIAYEYYKSILPTGITLIKGAEDPGITYPDDCAYNVSKMGNRVIGNVLYIDPVIKQIYTDMSFKFINVKQGYTKCNMCIVDQNSAITEDRGIYAVLKSHNIDVLTLNTTEVKLKGFKNGFIGGASGFVGVNKIGFLGDLGKHTYENTVKKFITAKGVNITCLSSTGLKDFGSLLYF